MIVDAREELAFVSTTDAAISVIRIGDLLNPGTILDEHLEAWAEFVAGQRIQNAGVAQLTTPEILERRDILARRYGDRFPCGFSPSE